jgi:hypothetical protein
MIRRKLAHKYQDFVYIISHQEQLRVMAEESDFETKLIFKN